MEMPAGSGMANGSSHDGETVRLHWNIGSALEVHWRWYPALHLIDDGGLLTRASWSEHSYSAQIPIVCIMELSLEKL